MIDSYLTQLETDKDDLVDNLTTMGITGLTGDETFTELVPRVLEIPSGGNTLPIYSFLTDTATAQFSQTSLSTNDKNALSAIINDAYEKEYDNFNILFSYVTGISDNKNTYSERMLSINGRSYLKLTDEPTVLFFNSSMTDDSSSFISSSDTYIGLSRSVLYLTLSWSNHVCTVTGATYSYGYTNAPAYNNVLTKNQSASYTPTNSYHPATKKYVDDSIASAITDALGGSY